MNNFLHGEDCNCDNCLLDLDRKNFTTTDPTHISTPLTDAQIYSVYNSTIEKNEFVVLADFARQLERQLVQARLDGKELYEALELAENALDDYCPNSHTRKLVLDVLNKPIHIENFRKEKV